jgi:DNA-binding SARP family transcriptional activator/tetratricopeptide (TPR) repeat protein
MSGSGPTGQASVQVGLLGRFTIKLGDKKVAAWGRPTAKRLCELLMVTNGHRIGREAACELLFPNLGPASATNALSKALSLAHDALSCLGEEASALVNADRGHIWVEPGCPLEIDCVTHERSLLSALQMAPGHERDAALCAALAVEGVLLEDEPYADWALRPREALELLRQRARLELARDRSRGSGRSRPNEVIEGWEGCFVHDPSSEEAASALIRAYAAGGRRQLAQSTFERCRDALESLGLRISPALEEAYRAGAGTVRPVPVRSVPVSSRAAVPPLHRQPLARYKEERRLVTALFAELSNPVGTGRPSDLEDLRRVVGDALATLIADVEAFGGTVTSVSGVGLAALFGAPLAHEDDPERALRAGSRIISRVATGDVAGNLAARVGIETGPAIVGPLGAAGHLQYGAVGDVVGLAGSLQSAAKMGSVLVGPATRAATDTAFVWGPTEEIVLAPTAKPIVGSYLERPEARAVGYHGRPKLAGRAPLIGRETELSLLDHALREATSGTGSVTFVVGEPGLGKTRLVQECRKRFMAWVGAGTGRLPLWMEGRCASYASSTPFGLYRQLLSAWVGVSAEEGEEALGPALSHATKAMFGADDDHFPFLAHMMGFVGDRAAKRLSGMSPETLQRSTFAAVRAVVARLAAAGPTVLALEDLHWADPTSVRVTQDLAALAATYPLVVLVTRRPEPDPGVSDLERLLEIGDGPCRLRRIELAPLPEAGERALVASLLGGDGPVPVVETVRAGVDGNPLFLEERFLSLVETGTLVRRQGAWSVRAGTEVPAVPAVLERLIRSRVDRVGDQERETVEAASVLGTEFDRPLLGALTETGGELTSVLEKLCAAGLFTEVHVSPEPVYRFRHALIQEATYLGLLRGRRRHLHARAASAIEMASTGRAEEIAAVLGHHLAMAGQAERAVLFLEIAGDHAVSIFANDEAVTSYRYALATADKDGSSDVLAVAAVDLRAKLSEVLWRNARFDEARETLGEALQLVGSGEELKAARFYARLGRVEVEDHQFGSAVAAFEAANELLGDDLDGKDDEWVDLWLEVQSDGLSSLFYWADDPERAKAVLEKARPVADARGSAGRRAGIYVNLTNQRNRETRYRIDEGTLATARTALKAAEVGIGEHDMGAVVSSLGFVLLWHGDLGEAQEKLRTGLEIGERIGDSFRQAMCLCYLTLTAVRRHDVEAVQSLAPQTLAAAEAAHYPGYIGSARAAMAWAAWKREEFDLTAALATEALELWASLVVTFPFQWSCLFPLLSARLGRGQLDEAIECGRRLLEPPQLRLPDELETVLKAAVAAWDRGDPRLATEELSAALELATYLRYA